MQKKGLNIDLLEVQKTAFKRGIFDFICKDKDKHHKKQEQALKILKDNTTTEFLYGGAAGGAKSWTGATWLLFMCLTYPNSKWFIGRESLKRLRESTLITFYKVCKEYNIPTQAYKYNGQDHYLIFENGSRIDLLDLRYLPSDPLYERYGSLEYTGGWIEEGGEVNYGAVDTLKTRVGRHLNDKYNIKPKIFITCNPKKNWLYSYFYKPFIEGSLRKGQVFLQAFVQDNPFIESSYIEQLKSTTDKIKKERLLKGNWEYDDNPYKLCDYNKILALFENDHLFGNKPKYITADIARFGSDSAVIILWKGWEILELYEFETSKITEIQACILALRKKHQVPKSNCIADEDGVGGGVVDNLNIVGFTNNARPFDEHISKGITDTPSYKNMQTQLLVYLATQIINKNSMYISAEISEKQKDKIKEDLDTIEQIPDTAVITLKSKAQIKQEIGRSPDFRDAIFMRAYFDFAKTEIQDLQGLFF